MDPLTARVHDGKLVLEIDQQRFLADALAHPQLDLAVVDPAQFMRFVCEHIFSLSHDVDEAGAHPSWWTRLSQALAHAAAHADQGVRERQAIEPTCGCDPEEHDGG